LQVRRKITQPKCVGWHVDDISETFVSCSGVDTSGQYVAFYWEVDDGVSPKDGRLMWGRHITALTRATAVLTPAYKPEGRALSDMPTEPSMTAQALYGR
jgi:hypothetical protein